MARPSKTGIIEYKDFLEALRTVKRYGQQVSLHYEDVRADMDSVSRFMKLPHDTRIKELPVSRRTMNVLTRFKVLSGADSILSDLGKVSRSEIENEKNLGKRTMFEIDELCLYAGIEMLP